FRPGAEGPIQKTSELGELFLWQRRERRVVRAGGGVHRRGEAPALLGQEPAAGPFFGEAGATRGRGHRQPPPRDGAVHTCEVPRFGARAAVAAVGQVYRPDERRPIEAKLLGLLERERHLGAALVQKKREEGRDLDRVRRPHPVIVPKELTRRALLLAPPGLDAVRRLGDEVGARLGYFPPAADAAAVLPAVRAPQSFVDEANASPEQRLPSERECGHLGCACHV